MMWRKVIYHDDYLYFRCGEWRKCNYYAIIHMIDNLKIKDLKIKKNMSKYKEEIIIDGIGTTNGYWYDITDGGYIKPEEVLVDPIRAEQLNNAIQLLRNWEQELRDDGILNEY